MLRDLSEAKSRIFLAKVIGLIILTVLAPAFALPILRSMSGGYAAGTMVLSAMVLPLCALVIGFFLLSITKKRIEYLGLSNTLLLLFPIWPIYLLMSGPINFVMGGWMIGNQLFHPYLSSTALLGMFCVTLLTVITLDKVDSWRGVNGVVWTKIQKITDCKGAINAKDFRVLVLKFLIAFLTLILVPIIIFKSFYNLGVYSQIAQYIIAFLREIISSILILAFFSSSIRRLNDMGKKWIYAIPMLYVGILISKAIFGFQKDLETLMNPNLQNNFVFVLTLITGFAVPAIVLVTLLWLGISKSNKSASEKLSAVETG